MVIVIVTKKTLMKTQNLKFHKVLSVFSTLTSIASQALTAMFHASNLVPSKMILLLNPMVLLLMMMALALKLSSHLIAQEMAATGTQIRPLITAVKVHGMTLIFQSIIAAFACDDQQSD